MPSLYSLGVTITGMLPMSIMLLPPSLLLGSLPKRWVSYTRAAVWAECMRADGAIVSSDGWGNSDVDYTNTVYQLGIRGIPVTGLNFSGTMAQFVVTNEYLDAIVDISKNPEGIESENVGENAVDALDARKALAMLKIKMRKKEHQG